MFAMPRLTQRAAHDREIGSDEICAPQALSYEEIDAIQNLIIRRSATIAVTVPSHDASKTSDGKWCPRMTLLIATPIARKSHSTLRRGQRHDIAMAIANATVVWPDGIESAIDRSDGSKTPQGPAKSIVE